jgi:hypothetical protein
MSIKRRHIDVTITLGTGAYGETVGEVITLKGHRIQADMAAVGGDAQGQLSLRIYGLTLSRMNQLTTIGPIMTSRRGKNRVTVMAYEDDATPSMLFDGSIDTAWGDFQGAPDIVLHVTALSAGVAAVKSVTPSSYKGSVDVVEILGDLATLAGFSELSNPNNAVSGIRLSDPYFKGSALEQIRQCATAANIPYTDDRGILDRWPLGGSRVADVPIIGPETGLVGYPTFSSNGLGVQCIYHPGVLMGGQINVKSSLSVANGLWNVFSVGHTLESERPGGAWFTFIDCFRAPT